MHKYGKVIDRAKAGGEALEASPCRSGVAIIWVAMPGADARGEQERRRKARKIVSTRECVRIVDTAGPRLSTVELLPLGAPRAFLAPRTEGIELFLHHDSAGRKGKHRFQRQLRADTSHELNNPVGAWRLRIDLPQLELQPDRQHAAAAGVVAELERVEEILDGVLSLEAFKLLPGLSFAERRPYFFADLDWFWNHYLSAPEDADNPLATPSKASSLAGLPPTLIQTVEYEVHRDEAEAYRTQLSDAGFPTEIVRFDGLVHGVYWISGAIPRVIEMPSAASEFLRTHFSKTAIPIQLTAP